MLWIDAGTFLFCQRTIEIQSEKEYKRSIRTASITLFELLDWLVEENDAVLENHFRNYNYFNERAEEIPSFSSL